MAADSNSSFSSSGTWSITDLIFLCYARADRAQVEAVAAALRARGASVWYDATSASGASAYVESAQRALRRTALMLVFVSSSAVKSNWVMDEVRGYRSLMARESGHSLLAVHLDRTRAPIWLAGAGALDARGVAPDETATQIAEIAGLHSLSRAPISAPLAPMSASAPPLAAAAAPPAVTSTAAAAAAPVATGPVYATFDPADSVRMQPVVTALTNRGVTVAENGASGLQQAQTLLVAISSASATSSTVSGDVSSFHAQGDSGSRLVIGMHLDQTASPDMLNGASAVDAQSLSPDDTARLIIAALPLGAAPTTVAATPADTMPADTMAMQTSTIADAPAAPEAAAEPTPLTPSLVDVTDAAHVESAPEMDTTETAGAAPASSNGATPTGAEAEATPAVASAAPSDAEMMAGASGMAAVATGAGMAEMAASEALAEAPAEAPAEATAPAEMAAPTDVAAASAEPAAADMSAPAEAPADAAPPTETAPTEAAPTAEAAAPAADAALVADEAAPPAAESAPVVAETMAATAPAMAAISNAPTPASQPDAVVASLRAEQSAAEEAKATAPATPAAAPASSRGSIIAVIIIIAALLALTIGLWINAGMPQ